MRSVFALQPHMMCYGNRTDLLRNDVICNTVIWVVYTVLALTIASIALRRKVPYSPIWYGLSAVIGFCGVSHLLHIITLFDTNFFEVAAVVEDTTALVSLSLLVAVLGLLKDILRFFQPKEDPNLQQAAKFDSIRETNRRTTELLKINATRVENFSRMAEVSSAPHR